MKTITVVGGNLWQIAAREMNDALQAPRIAVLNGITDPFLTGQVTLIIPPPDATQSTGLTPTS